jgi:UDP-GlcNAc:undecaprenyl-phosphate GlcNAc-1-phosphate transferase
VTVHAVELVVAAGATLALAPLVSALLRRFAVIDHPGARSSHRQPTLRGGGLAPSIAGSVVLALALAPGFRGLVVAVVAFGAVGLIEDVRGITAKRRLALHVLIAAVTVPLMLGDASIDGRLFVGAAALAALALVTYVNAFNFMDGIDGISVVHAGVAGLSFIVAGTVTGADALTVGGAVCVGTAVGFAPSNVPRARVFLGDVGSYFFGGLVGALAIVGVAGGIPPEAVLAPLLLYLADTGTTLLRRVRAGEAWLSPHRSHVYQRLTDLGFTHIEVSAGVGGLMAVSALLGAVSLTGSLPGRIAADAVLLVVIALYLMSPRLLRRKARKPTVSVPAASARGEGQGPKPGQRRGQTVPKLDGSRVRKELA